MKLRNKKTGEIVDFGYLQSDHIAPLLLTTYENDKPEMSTFNSLAELNEDWEDYEEPKKGWYLDSYGKPIEIVFGGDNFKQALEAIGNYFETKEEAEKAVEKLKAWKRLKDKGFRFETFGFARQAVTMGRVNLMVKATFNDEYRNEGIKLSDLDLLFGGEE